MGLMGVVLSTGPVLGPVLGGLIIQAMDWRWMFLINLPIGVVALALALWVIPSDPAASERPRTRLDVIGVALLSPGFAFLILALLQSAEGSSFGSPAAVVYLLLGLLLLGGYVFHALRVHHTPPLIDLRLFTSQSFAASVTVQGLVGMATYASIFALPLYYQQANDHGVGAAGLLVAPLGIGSALAMPVAGRLSDRFGARRLAAGGALVATVGALLFTRIGPDTGEEWPMFAALLVGAGLGFVGAPAMGSVYRTLPSAKVPQGSSVLYNLNQLGAAVGVAVVAFIMVAFGDGDPLGGFHGVYWFVAGSCLVILGATAFLPGRPKESSAPAPERPVEGHGGGADEGRRSAAQDR
jgi:EmrB/QacA subfamily drug resistance transporter